MKCFKHTVINFILMFLVLVILLIEMSQWLLGFEHSVKYMRYDIALGLHSYTNCQKFKTSGKNWWQLVTQRR